MMLSGTVTKRLEAELRETPLADREIRQIAGMGQMYFAAHADLPENYERLFTLKLNLQSYHCYRREAPKT